MSNKVNGNNEVILNNKAENIEIETLDSVRGYIITAQKQIYSAVNFAMVTAYWKIGKQIYEACGENERAE